MKKRKWNARIWVDDFWENRLRAIRWDIPVRLFRLKCRQNSVVKREEKTKRFRRMGWIETEWVKVMKKIFIQIYDSEFWSCGGIVAEKKSILKTKWNNCGKMIYNLKLDEVKKMKIRNRNWWLVTALILNDDIHINPWESCCWLFVRVRMSRSDIPVRLVLRK
jgi:hypothetical protein